MTIRKQHVLMGLVVAAILVGVAVGTPDERQRDKKELDKLLAILAAGVRSDTSVPGVGYRVWAVTIQGFTKAGDTNNGKCTADTQWQELYASSSAPAQSDQIAFQSSDATTYTICFTQGSPIQDAAGHTNNFTITNAPTQYTLNINVANNGACNSSTYSKSTNGSCAYPYTIGTGAVQCNNIAATQCNNGTLAPFGSDGLVVHGGS